MNTVTSKDGTTIAYDRSGAGPALVLVGGMFEQRAMDSETARLAVQPLLNAHFTVYHFDRRGRGESTDTPPFTVAREIEDIEAVIDRAGGSAHVFGISSGAALALEAAAALESKVKKLALYEPPYNDDPEARRSWVEFRKQLGRALAEGRHADAVALFMMLVGATPEQVEEIKQMPMWPMWEGIAPTIAYDAAAVGEEAAVPLQRSARVAVPVLVMDGSESFPFMHVTAATLAQAMPNAQHRTLEGQTHEVDANVLAPILVEFFNS
jgi:pimeloyl-ACP methyl ester carboxylesterase